jgi:hypothetical protein
MPPTELKVKDEARMSIVNEAEEGRGRGRQREIPHCDPPIVTTAD